MRDLNIDFMDLYKCVDKFIRDAYGSAEGVSEYIRQMEQNDYKGSRYVSTWGTDYDMLKHLRWIRNQLSHEVGYDSDICEESDYDWLDSFRGRLYSANDPMAIMNKAEEAERQRRLAEQRRKQAQMRQQQKSAESYNTYTPRQQYQMPKHKTFWQRIKEFFTGD